MTEKADDPVALRRSTAIWFAFCLTVFLATNALVRWLRWTIFHGHGAYSWTPPTPFDYVHLLISAVVPFFVIAGLAHAALIRFATTRTRVIAIAVCVYIALLVLEMDVHWYKMSARHVSTGEVYIFLFEDWRKHMGIQSSDVLQFAEAACLHAAAFVLCWLLAKALAGRFRPWQPRPLYAAGAAIALLVADSQWMALQIAHAADNRQWRALSALHPLRSAALDGFYLRFGPEARFVGDINARYRTTPPADTDWPNPLLTGDEPASVRRLNVVILAIEGLNIHYFDQLTALDALRKTSRVGHNHYSTGDATHYGMLGIAHGMPMLIYGGTRRPQSQYIDALNRAGYKTRRFGADTTVFGQIGQYTANFSLPMVAPPNDSAMLTDIGKHLADTSTPRFALIYYFGTHWPYQHSDRYHRYAPEVPPDFNYSSWDLVDHRQEIINRYRNCLDELNDWLAQFLGRIDLANTILVITGDHGEEMFEQGRMTHAAGTWEGQIRTALVVHVPGVPAGEIDTITSHAQIMPAVMKWLGLANTVPPNPFARSCLIAAHNNHIFRPKEFVCVTPRYKLNFSIVDNDHFQINFITDRSDQPVFNVPAGDDALNQALRSLKAAEVAWRRYFD